MIDSHATRGDLRDTVFDLKHDPGGLVDVEFIVQYLVLGHSHAHHELTGNKGNIALLKMAADAGLIPGRAGRDRAQRLPRLPGGRAGGQRMSRGLGHQGQDRQGRQLHLHAEGQGCEEAGEGIDPVRPAPAISMAARHWAARNRSIDQVVPLN
jgi:hypothetical protein